MSKSNIIRVWDIPVRFFHWTLVVLFAAAYITGEETETLHAYLGYGIIGLILFRIVWGFIGTKHARFSDFIYGPRVVFRYIRQLFSRTPEHYRGHNPAAGWMVLLLLISVMATCWTGLEVYAAKGQGPLANTAFTVVSDATADGFEREEDEDEHEGHKEDEDEHAGHGENEGPEEEFWEEIHEALTNFTLFLIFFHILAVFVSSWLHGENLVRAMITGTKRS